MRKRSDIVTDASIVGKRIALLRTKRGLNQDEFAQALSELCSRQKPYSLQIISAWESGRRLPTEKMFGILSHFFGVTEEYLRGLSSDPDSMIVEENESGLEIDVNDLKDFDGRVVYVIFHNHAHEDQIAIVNSDKETLIMKNGYIRYPNPQIKAIYANEPDYVYFKSKSGRYPLTMSGLLNTQANLIWIESKSPDPVIRSQYNGWYRRNEHNTALINSIGLTLPLEGLNISYYAYLSNEK